MRHKTPSKITEHPVFAAVHQGVAEMPTVPARKMLNIPCTQTNISPSSAPHCNSIFVDALCFLSGQPFLVSVEYRYPDFTRTLVVLFGDLSCRDRRAVDIFTVDILCFTYEGRPVLAASVALLEPVQFKLLGETRQHKQGWKIRERPYCLEAYRENPLLLASEDSVSRNKSGGV